MEMYLSGTPDKLVDFNIRNRTLNIAEEKLPFEKDALAATASKDRNIGSYYGGAGNQLKADANQARLEGMFKPYLDGREKVENWMSDKKKQEVTDKNSRIEAQVGTALNIYQDPANKSIKSSGNAMEASRALYDIKVIADPNKKGELGLDLSRWSEPAEGDKFAGSHYIYKGAGGGAVYVPRDRVQIAIDRAKSLASQNK
jgi:predicted metalloendopeptidase